MELTCWDYRGHKICIDGEGSFMVDDTVHLISLDEATEYIDQISVNADISEYEDAHTYKVYLTDTQTNTNSIVEVAACSADEALNWVKKTYCSNCKILRWEMYK